jgi:hypothetical protein
MKIMPIWVEPAIWWILTAMGDVLMLAGVLTLALAFVILAYRGTEALIEKGDHHED